MRSEPPLSGVVSAMVEISRITQLRSFLHWSTADNDFGMDIWWPSGDLHRRDIVPASLQMEVLKVVTKLVNVCLYCDLRLLLFGLVSLPRSNVDYYMSRFFSAWQWMWYIRCLLEVSVSPGSRVRESLYHCSVAHFMRSRSPYNPTPLWLKRLDLACWLFSCCRSAVLYKSFPRRLSSKRDHRLLWWYWKGEKSVSVFALLRFIKKMRRRCRID